MILISCLFLINVSKYYILDVEMDFLHYLKYGFKVLCCLKKFKVETSPSSTQVYSLH